jgi:hypothetical protein
MLAERPLPAQFERIVQPGPNLMYWLRATLPRPAQYIVVGADDANMGNLRLMQGANDTPRQPAREIRSARGIQHTRKACLHLRATIQRNNGR